MLNILLILSCMTREGMIYIPYLCQTESLRQLEMRLHLHWHSKLFGSASYLHYLRLPPMGSLLMLLFCLEAVLRATICHVPHVLRDRSRFLAFKKKIPAPYIYRADISFSGSTRRVLGFTCQRRGPVSFITLRDGPFISIREADPCALSPTQLDFSCSRGPDSLFEVPSHLEALTLYSRLPFA